MTDIRDHSTPPPRVQYVFYCHDIVTCGISFNEAITIVRWGLHPALTHPQRILNILCWCRIYSDCYVTLPADYTLFNSEKPALLLGKNDSIAGEQGQSLTWQPFSGDVGIPPSSKGIAGWLRFFSGVVWRGFVMCRLWIMDFRVTILDSRQVSDAKSWLVSYNVILKWQSFSADHFDERAYNITPGYSVLTLIWHWYCMTLQSKQTGILGVFGGPERRLEVSCCMHHFVTDSSQHELLRKTKALVGWGWWSILWWTTI